MSDHTPLKGRLAIEDRLYRLYMEFFERAERERRWSVFDDIPWDQVNPEASEHLALCAETFASVEMYLPDYVAGGINSVRDYFGRAWWQANWGYEESKHSLALGEYLLRSGKRTRDFYIKYGYVEKECFTVGIAKDDDGHASFAEFYAMVRPAKAWAKGL